MISQELLKSLFNYNETTGSFSNKIRRGQSGYIGKEAGALDSAGYKVVTIEKKTYKIHRLIFLYMLGTLPKAVDHINGDRSDNRWSNLRETTALTNNHNRRLDSTSTTKIKGVSWYNNRKMKGALARYSVDYRRECKFFPLSIYETQESCINAATNWVRVKRELEHKEFANHGN